MGADDPPNQECPEWPELRVVALEGARVRIPSSTPLTAVSSTGVAAALQAARRTLAAWPSVAQRRLRPARGEQRVRAARCRDALSGMLSPRPAAGRPGPDMSRGRATIGCYADDRDGDY